MDKAAIVRRWDDTLNRRATNPKVRPLEAAIRESVEPGDLIYLGGSLAKPNAAMFELIRAFAGQSPDFTVATPAFANQHVPLVHSGLVRKAITAIHGAIFPAPGPNPVYNRALEEGRIEFESWSLLTFALRLKAGAMGLPFLPTRSLIGSDLGLELERKGLVSRIADTVGGAELTIVRALHPDVAIIHGLAADPHGNTVLCPPYYDNTSAAFAAKRSVIVTVERVVEPRFIRRYAHLTKVPGSVVTAVCEVPLGGHPTGLNGEPIPEIDGYLDDYGFLQDIRDASESPEAMESWIEEWITGCNGHAAYLAKLGSERVKRLKAETAPDTWKREVSTRSSRPRTTPATQAETQICIAARAIRERIRTYGYRVLLAGLGVSSLAAWLAAFTWWEEGGAIELLVEAGSYGYVPMPMDPFLFNYRNIQTAAALGDLEQVLGVMTGGFQNQALGVLAAAQVDQDGNLNSSHLPGLLLTGSGGANDIASAAAEILVTVPHSSRRLVRRVDFITSPGQRVRTIATGRALLERDEDNSFQITHVVGKAGAQADELVREMQTISDWNMPASPVVQIIEPATAAELELIRVFDPEGFFLGI